MTTQTESFDVENSTTTAKRVVGRPFKPGVTGNPGGRPKGLAALVREKTKDGQDPIGFLVRVLKGKIRGVKMEHRIAAAKELLDRGFGRAVQAIEHSGSTNADSRPLQEFSIEELRKFLAMAEQVDKTPGNTVP